MENLYLIHHGVKGQKHGVRNAEWYPIADWKAHLARKSSGETLFVSGSSKTQDKNSEFYRKKLPKPVRTEIKKSMKNKDRIIVGDAPGIDRQVQDFLNKYGYMDVEIFGPGKEVRYQANKNWKSNPIDAPEFEEGSKEWLAKKDKVMTDEATKALAVTITGGSSATRKNIDRLIEQNKDVKVYELNGFSPNGKHDYIQNPYLSGTEHQRLSKTLEKLNEKYILNDKKLTKKESELLVEAYDKLLALEDKMDEWDEEHGVIYPSKSGEKIKRPKKW